MITDKTLADSRADFPDFAKGGIVNAVEPDGRVDRLPINSIRGSIYYNKELFAAKGLAYPKKFAELLMPRRSSRV